MCHQVLMSKQQSTNITFHAPSNNSSSPLGLPPILNLLVSHVDIGNFNKKYYTFTRLWCVKLSHFIAKKQKGQKIDLT